MKLLAKRTLSVFIAVLMLFTVMNIGITASAFTVSSEENQVSLSGDFNDWSTTSNIMEKTSENLYSTSIELDYGTHYFNIVHNGLWYGEAIAFSNGANNKALKMSGGACALVATGGTYEFTYDTSAKRITIIQTAVAEPADHANVYLAADFNNWDQSSNIMTKASSTSVTTKVTLKAGTYLFKIVCNGLWYGNTGIIENTTKAGNSNLGWTMYSDQGNCTLKASGGVYTFRYDVTTNMLNVDYDSSSMDPVNLTTVSLSGDFNDWSTTANIMKRSSSYYVSTSVDLKAGTYYFKIVQDGLWYGSNNVLPNTANDFQLSAVEGNCSIKTLGGTYTFMYNVVNHKLTMLYTPKETDPAETAIVSIAGTFNDWSKTANTLTYSETNTVSTSIELNAGTYNFKIVHNELWYGNNGIISDSTTTTSDTGWKLAITNGDCTLEASGGKYTFNYNVITNNLIVLFEGTISDPADNAIVALAGSFNDWSTTANILEKSSPKIVSTTIDLPQGTYYFKLVRNGLWYGNEGTIVDRTNATSINGWAMSPTAIECTLQATGGTYTFEYDVTTNTLVINCTLSDPAKTAVVCIAGDFNGWSQTANKLTYSAENTVSTTFDIEGGTYLFKVVHNGLWYGNNGTIIDTTTTTSDIGWDMTMTAPECKLQATGGTYTFTYNVLTGKLVITSKITAKDPAKTAVVSLSGEFNDWSQTANVFKYSGENVVTTSVFLFPGTYKFKIVDDSLWYGNSGTIVNTTNSTSITGWQLDYTAIDCTLDASGGTYTFNYNVITKELIVLCNLDDYDPAQYSDVRLVGDFNNWDTEASKMTYVGDRAVLIDVELGAGSYQFKIVEDGVWYGNNGTIADKTTDTSAIGWTLTEKEGNCTLQTSGGKYTFIYRVVPNTIIIFHNYDHNYLD